MRNLQTDDKEVTEFTFHSENVDRFLKRNLPQDHSFVHRNEFHGDYDLDWIIHLDENGKELSRYSCRYVGQIRWKT